MYKGPMDKDKGRRVGLNVGGGRAGEGNKGEMAATVIEKQ